MNNVITVHEILHYVKTTKEHGLLLKLDFEKAFDNVETIVWFYLMIYQTHTLNFKNEYVRERFKFIFTCC
jgi:hypothetical protein